MVNIDYERLLLIVMNDIDESEHQNFNIENIVQNARISSDETKIIIETPKFWFSYDINTYEQIGGGGGSPDHDNDLNIPTDLEVEIYE